MSDTSRCVSIVATSHDSQGTVTWQSEDGQKYISANSNANTPLLFDSEYKTAGKLLHMDGSYYLKETEMTCRQRGSCEKSCRCMDCPYQLDQNSALLQAAEMHTELTFGGVAAGLSKMGKGLSNNAKKAGSIIKAGYNAAKKEYSAQKEAREHLEEAKKHHAKAVAAVSKISDRYHRLEENQQKKFDEVKAALGKAQELLNELEELLKPQPAEVAQAPAG